MRDRWERRSMTGIILVDDGFLAFISTLISFSILCVLLVHHGLTQDIFKYLQYLRQYLPCDSHSSSVKTEFVADKYLKQNVSENVSLLMSRGRV